MVKQNADGGATTMGEATEGDAALATTIGEAANDVAIAQKLKKNTRNERNKKLTNDDRYRGGMAGDRRGLSSRDLEIKRKREAQGLLKGPNISPTSFGR